MNCVDSINSILGDRNFDEPPEVASVKKYVRDNFQTEISVLVRDHDLVISVPNAALASTLRFRLPEIKRRCQIEKRLVIRIA